MLEVKVRRAVRDELAWVNESYARVGFRPSDFSREVVVVAEIGEQLAGLGRLVRVNESDAELGGILVFEEYRNRGVAAKIVQLLVDHCAAYERVFCLPFSHLSGFYQRFGFHPWVTGRADLPREIAEKHAWCNRTYEHGTLLLVAETKKN